jgi:hypothetical protein
VGGTNPKSQILEQGTLVVGVNPKSKIQNPKSKIGQGGMGVWVYPLGIENFCKRSDSYQHYWTVLVIFHLEM